MSELKERMLGQTMSSYGCDTKIYLKSEADKVIADLEESHKMEVEQLLIEIAELKAQKAQAEDDCAYWKMSEGNAVNAMHETEEACMFITESERRQKYKRCLAMAEWCSFKAECFDLYSRHTDYLPSIEKYKRKRNHYADRCNNLLLLAEKFKEAK